MSTRKAVALGCLIAVLGPVALLAWAILGYFSAPQPAWSVAWSPDGKLLAAGYGGYGVSDGAVLAKLNGDPDWDAMSPKGLSLALTSDGKTLAGGTGHGDVWLWKMP